jgi:predicted nucleotidyltransferase component of viral defense system
MNQDYINTVRLLLDIAPSVFKSKYFALKGGTALNLFIQDLPRLSVDIDVVFTDYGMDRISALARIAEELANAKTAIERLGYSVRILSTKAGDDVKMLVEDEASQVKVEVNFVFRGTVLPVTELSLTKKTQGIFSTNITLPVLDCAELYGSKLVAALDRQHPRDMFDVLKMFEKFGLRPQFIDCFVAYIAGHNRPVHEVIFGNTQSLEVAYKNEFEGMTTEPTSLAELEQTQRKIFKDLPNALTPDHKAFLLSLVSLAPQWDLMPFKNLKDLPAIRWKQQNLEKLKSRSPANFKFQHDELLRRFQAVTGQ